MDTFWKQAFREAMKKEGHNLSWLAKKLKMSLPGLKKVFQRDDIPLGRFTQICHLLKLDPTDLIKENESRGFKLQKLTPEIDSYFMREPQAFVLYWNLTVEKWDLKTCLDEMKISRSSALKILRKLDQFGLVRWLESDSVEIPRQPPYLFDKSLHCIRRFMDVHARHVLDDAVKGNVVTMRYLSLPKDKYALAREQVLEVIDRMSFESSYKGEAEANAAGEDPFRLVFCFLPGRVRF